MNNDEVIKAREARKALVSESGETPSTSPGIAKDYDPELTEALKEVLDFDCDWSTVTESDIIDIVKVRFPNLIRFLRTMNLPLSKDFDEIFSKMCDDFIKHTLYHITGQACYHPLFRQSEEYQRYVRVENALRNILKGKG